MTSQIRLRGVHGDIDGKIWESDNILRFGRLGTLEIVLEDSSVSRRHAEIRPTPQGWKIRDLGSTNGTFLNGTRLGPGEYPVHQQDIIRCGNLTLVVDQVKEIPEEDTPASNVSWEVPTSDLAFDRNHGSRHILAAGQHLVQLETEEQLLRHVLNDAISTLDAQRGAIVLADGSNGPLCLRVFAIEHRHNSSPPGFNEILANRAFRCGASVLCTRVDQDQELAGNKAILDDTMASVLCILLRTPRERLGILHLDRGPLQKAFNKEDLRLADAMSAHISAGIEKVRLIRKQCDLFYATMNMLAQPIKMRDPYTGGHSERVAKFSVMLAEELKVSTQELHLIKIGAPLHDVGKIGIADSILRKPGRLTKEELAIMKTHTTKGARILEQVAELKDVLPIVRSHHERWDGQGYPDGLSGESIPRLSRIVGVTEAFDWMTSEKPFLQMRLSPESAFEEILRKSGTQFDPAIAEAFLHIQDQIIKAMI